MITKSLGLSQLIEQIQVEQSKEYSLKLQSILEDLIILQDEELPQLMDDFYQRGYTDGYNDGLWKGQKL